MTTRAFAALPLLAVLAGPARCSPSQSARPVPIDAFVVAKHVRWLADDAREGRGIGTKGLDESADYIANEMKEAGLEPGGGTEGSYFQPFEMTTGVQLGENAASSQTAASVKNTAQLGNTPLAMDDTWRPLALSESATVTADLVFAGFGITAPELSWDDYAGLDVKGKIVLVLRHEPGEKDPKSAFAGLDLTRYAEIRVKAINARVHGATGMILVNDIAGHEPGDELLALGGDAEASFAGIVAIQATRKAVDAALPAGTTVAGLEKQIADGGKPASQALAPAHATLTVNLKKTKKPVKNVIGFLRGSDPALAREAIVIGAHYDHLGLGTVDSLDPNNMGKPHNGADDNASGTSAVLAIARSIGRFGTRPKRSLVFICFTAEEAGLGGSSWYVNHPTWSLENTAAMLNMDMIGRMRDKKVIVFGAATGKEFDALLEAANEEKLSITATGDGYGPSDQTAFYAKDIPVLHFFTGAHADYHRTTDDAEKIDSEGLAQVARLVRHVAMDLGNRDTRVTFVPSGQIAHAQGQTGGTRGYGTFFGSIPDFSESEEPGVAITGTRAGSPAEKAGLASGDRIVKFGEVDVNNLNDLMFALQKYKPGDVVQVSYVRAGKTTTVPATLAKRE